MASFFVTQEMKQVVGAVDHVTLVRGEDRFGHFRSEPEPAFDFGPEKLEAVDGMLRGRFYAGARDRQPWPVHPTTFGSTILYQS